MKVPPTTQPHRDRAEPLASAPSPPQHPRKNDASSAQARAECAAHDGEKRWGCRERRWLPLTTPSQGEGSHGSAPRAVRRRADPETAAPRRRHTQTRAAPLTSRADDQKPARRAREGASSSATSPAGGSRLVARNHARLGESVRRSPPVQQLVRKRAGVADYSAGDGERDSVMQQLSARATRRCEHAQQATRHPSLTARVSTSPSMPPARRLRFCKSLAWRASIAASAKASAHEPTCTTRGPAPGVVMLPALEQRSVFFSVQRVGTYIKRVRCAAVVRCARSSSASAAFASSFRHACFRTRGVSP